MFEAVWDAVETIIKTLTDEFPAGSVSKGDYSILESGLDNLAVLVPGPMGEPQVHGDGFTIRNWVCYIDLFYRLTQQRDTDWAAFVTLRDTLVGRLERYPSLNAVAGITRVRAIAESDPIETYDEDDEGPFHIYQQVAVVVQETATVTGGEYGS